MADQDDDLAEAIRELTRTLEEVGEELRADRSRSPFRGPSGSSLRPPLRPPTPREFLAFTDEVALPALLAALESSVRTLEAFQRGVRLVRTERDARYRVAETTGVSSDRATDLRRTTLDHLDTVLTELQRATAAGTLPADDRARELLEEARELRDDVDDRLRRATETETKTETEPGDRASSNGVRIDVQSGVPDQPLESDDDRDSEDDLEPDDQSAVDVDAELETLKDRYGQDEADAAASSSSSNGSDAPPGETDATPDDTDDDDAGDVPSAADANDADDDEEDEDEDDAGDDSDSSSTTE